MTTKQYRERHKIIADMLQTISDSGAIGAPRTSIMYKSFLSYAQLKEYLFFLTKRGLIEEFPRRMNSGNDKLVYKITEKGLHFLKIYDEINSLIGPDTVGNNRL